MKLKFLSIAISTLILSGCGGSGSESNSAPQFSQAAYSSSLDEDSSLTFTVSATDTNNDQLSYSLANAASNGSVNVNTSTGEVTYLPDSNFNGADAFQVMVSDGKDSATTTVSINVLAVNDDPVISIDKVQVSGGETKVGTVAATDIDADTLKYTISKQAINGDLTLNSDTGEITYSPITLSNAVDSFELTVDDGNGGTVSKTLEISANLSTNADRAYYYYASEQSHLKRSEQLSNTLQNDINIGEVNSALAIGYAEAGLENETERLITQDSIIRDEVRALALVNVANQYTLLGKLERANELRLEASNLYSTYIATKGISAFTADDQDFFYTLAESYLNAGEPTLALQSYNILDILLSSALDEEQTTQALRLFFGFRNTVEDVINIWLETRTEQDFQYAKDMVDRLYTFANKIGYSYVSNDRNGNEGEKYYSIRLVALTNVVESYITLNEIDDAKNAIADALALNGVVNYDDAYPREADEYAQVTLTEYPFGLVDYAKHLVTLYPEIDIETVLLSKFDKDSFYYDWAKEDAEEALLFAYVRSIEDADESLALILAQKDESDLRNLFTTITSFNSSNPGGSAILIEQGRYADAAKYIAEGLRVLSTEEYLAQNIATQAFVTGATGCQLILDQLSTIINFTDEQTYIDQAVSTLTVCREISLQKYGQISGTDVTTDEIVDSSIDLIKYHYSLGQAELVSPLVEKAQSFITAYDDSQITQKLIDTGKLAAAFAYGCDFATALTHYTEYVELIKEIESLVSSEYQFSVTQDYFEATTTKDDYRFESYYKLLLRQAGKIDNYQQLHEETTTLWADLVKWNITRLDEASLQTQLQYYPQFAEQYLAIGQFDSALELKDKGSLGVVEHDSILTSVIESLSQFDAFTGVSIATVDTDNDGKANFFLPYASEQMIAESAIELDLDSDNDGVDDLTDAYPLDKTRQ